MIDETLLDLWCAETRYLEARGWRQLGPDEWGPPGETGSRRVYFHGHAVNAQKQEDYACRRRRRTVCGVMKGEARRSNGGGTATYQQCTLPRDHAGAHDFSGAPVSEVLT